MNIREILKISINELKNLENPTMESYMILGSVLKKDRLFLSLNLEKNINKLEEERIFSFINRRKANEPIAYILGKKEFYGNEFIVDEGVLVPRFDTEILVEEVLKILKNMRKEKIRGLEIGIGTGVISISLLKNETRLFMDMVDINENAIRNSKKNADKLNVSHRTNIFHSDLYENISSKYDFIISNPPYIKTDEISSLSEQIKNYEPLNALDGGRDGVYFYRKIIEGNNYLESQGFFAFEIGYDQAEKLRELLSENGFENFMLIKDLSNLDRVVIGMKI